MAIGTIDDLMQAVTISFPSPITLEETQEILGYVAQNLPASIDTKTEIYDHRYLDENGNLIESRGTVNISGSIRNTKNSASDGFNTTYESGDTSKINSLVFQAILGYSLEEHRPEVRELWRDVRQQVDAYFEQRSS